jgi:hypothetical protein
MANVINCEPNVKITHLFSKEIIQFYIQFLQSHKTLIKVQLIKHLIEDIYSVRLFMALIMYNFNYFYLFIAHSRHED